MAKKNSTDSASKGKQKKQRWYHQIWDVFQMVRRAQPSIPFVLLAILLGVVAIGVLVGMLFDQLLYFTLMAVPFGLLAAMFVLARRAGSVAYQRIEGDAGGVSAALGTIKRAWHSEEETVASHPAR